MSEWQPIETAPMDGTSILVHGNKAPGNPSGKMETCEAYNTSVAAWWAGENDGEGAWICYMGMVQEPECGFEPTHWMPMPEPPK